MYCTSPRRIFIVLFSVFFFFAFVFNLHLVHNHGYIESDILIGPTGCGSRINYMIGWIWLAGLPSPDVTDDSARAGLPDLKMIVNECEWEKKKAFFLYRDSYLIGPYNTNTASVFQRDTLREQCLKGFLVRLSPLVVCCAPFRTGVLGHPPEPPGPASRLPIIPSDAGWIL